jgi:hypothetical protein
MIKEYVSSNDCTRDIDHEVYVICLFTSMHAMGPCASVGVRLSEEVRSDTEQAM